MSRTCTYVQLLYPLGYSTNINSDNVWTTVVSGTHCRYSRSSHFSYFYRTFLSLVIIIYHLILILSLLSILCHLGFLLASFHLSLYFHHWLVNNNVTRIRIILFFSLPVDHGQSSHAGCIPKPTAGSQKQNKNWGRKEAMNLNRSSNLIQSRCVHARGMKMRWKKWGCSSENRKWGLVRFVVHTFARCVNGGCVI